MARGQEQIDLDAWLGNECSGGFQVPSEFVAGGGGGQVSPHSVQVAEENLGI